MTIDPCVIMLVLSVTFFLVGFGMAVYATLRSVQKVMNDAIWCLGVGMVLLGGYFAYGAVSTALQSR
jgi:hypothetical protein